jgi:hypothetical protein
MYVRCICGKKNRVEQGAGKVRCACGALVWADDTRPWVRIPEDSLAERKSNGKPVILRRPTRR